MSTELPDFNAHPAWLNYNDESYADWSLPDTISPEGLGPWTPLDTAEEWVKRIDRDKLAERLHKIFCGSELEDAGELSGLGDLAVRAYLRQAQQWAGAVLAALPELMGGGER
ncbi:MULTISPECIES: hypothetical protein [unclassified Luteococcus]|uniref:hypothetical protein n=1 Tax=unclassified Luteococcus TaxID=2639923 RepID=UPI00313D0CC9